MTLRCQDLCYGYGDQPVFDGLSLSIERGEVLAVIGPSGVGKSTLLELLGLRERPDAGAVVLDGTDPWALDPQQRLTMRRRIGAVFQQPSLFDASVRRNVTYGRRVRRSWSSRFRRSVGGLFGRPETSRIVRDALETVELSELIDTPVASLSGGEAQRVAFARALAVDPDVLVLDEPTSDLDPRNTALIEEAINDARERDIGVVIATHDMHQARRIADRVAVLLGTDRLEVGPTEKVLESPRDEWTRQFLDGELVY